MGRANDAKISHVFGIILGKGQSRHAAIRAADNRRDLRDIFGIK